MKTKLQIRDLPAALSIPSIPAPVVPQLRDLPVATFNPLAGLSVRRIDQVPVAETLEEVFAGL